MAVPESMTTADLSGRFVLNRTISDSTDRILTLQGVPWYTRKVIGYATLTVDLTHYYGKAADPEAKLPEDRNGDDFEHIDQYQSVSGISSTQENRTFSGLPRPHEDYVFGPVIGMSKRVPASDISDPSTVLGKYEFLQKGWTQDTLDTPKGLIYTTAKSDTERSNKTWTAEQVWGFEEIDGVKRYSRRVHFFTPDETVTARMVYDYIGPVPV